MDIVAEIASAHEGRMVTLLEMIDVAHDAKCTYIKFQIFRAKELVAKDHPKYDNYHVKEFSEKQWIDVADYCSKKPIKIIAEIFDYDSLLIARKMNISGYKVHSSAISDVILLENASKDNKLFLLSTGGSTKQEIHKGLKIINSNGNNQIILMHGFQNFPTELENVNLNKVESLKNEYNLPIGIQEHVEAGSIMSMITPLLAIAKGCVLIEKHFTLDRSLNESDYYSSLNPNELKQFVELVNKTLIVFGSDSFEMCDKELEYRHLLKKSIYTSRNIKMGEAFTLENICFKRSLKSDRILVDKIDEIISLKSSINIEANKRLTWEMVAK